MKLQNLDWRSIRGFSGLFVIPISAGAVFGYAAAGATDSTLVGAIVAFVVAKESLRSMATVCNAIMGPAVDSMKEALKVLQERESGDAPAQKEGN